MKRKGNLFSVICSIDNLNAADVIAQKGKSNQYGVKQHNKNKVENIIKLNKMLVEKTYQTSEYSIFKVYKTNVNFK